MQVEVLMFAGAAQLSGTPKLVVSVASGATIAAVAEAVLRQCPQLSGLLAASRWAVDRQFVATTQVLRGGEEVALIPPVSGG